MLFLGVDGVVPVNGYLEFIFVGILGIEKNITDGAQTSFGRIDLQEINVLNGYYFVVGFLVLMGRGGHANKYPTLILPSPFALKSATFLLLILGAIPGN